MPSISAEAAFSIQNLLNVPPLNYTQSFALKNMGHCRSVMFAKKPFENS
jgi:hypothetical protein